MHQNKNINGHIVNNKFKIKEKKLCWHSNQPSFQKQNPNQFGLVSDNILFQFSFSALFTKHHIVLTLFSIFKVLHFCTNNSNSPYEFISLLLFQYSQSL